jgi:hypothetical protein
VFEAYREPHNKDQDPLLQMIQSSPELISLKLEMFHGIDPRYEALDLNRFFEMLGTMFPRLRELALSGEAELDWDHVIHQTYNLSPIRLFFMNHQHIHTLVLSWLPKASIIVDPNAVQELFPALRDFTGSDFMCVALVQCDLRSQLEGLGIRIDPFEADSGTVGQVADAITDLPQLRRLEFPTDTSCGTYDSILEDYPVIDNHALQVILSASPKLAELEINAGYYRDVEAPVSDLSCFVCVTYHFHRTSLKKHSLTQKTFAYSSYRSRMNLCTSKVAKRLGPSCVVSLEFARGSLYTK